MKKLIPALMLAALASGSVLMTENQGLAAVTHGPAKARHSMVTPKQKTRAKKTTVRRRKASSKKKKNVGKVVRARKSRSHKAKTVNPAIGGGNPLPISQ